MPPNGQIVSDVWRALREAISAAEYVIAQSERRLDGAIGKPLREAIGRYASVMTIGIPIAWAVPGLRWTHASTYGLIAGVVLYAVLDVLRVRERLKRRS